MKIAFYSLALSVCVILPIRADLTIVYSTTVQPASQGQKVQTTPNAIAAATNMTIKVKGDRARIDASSQISVIFDGRTGELINLLNDQKTVVRISPDKMRAIADMLNKFNSKQARKSPDLHPRGRGKQSMVMIPSNTPTMDRILRRLTGSRRTTRTARQS